MKNAQYSEQALLTLRGGVEAPKNKNMATPPGPRPASYCGLLLYCIVLPAPARGCASGARLLPQGHPGGSPGQLEPIATDQARVWHCQGIMSWRGGLVRACHRPMPVLMLTADHEACPGAAIVVQEVKEAPCQQPRRSRPQILQRRPEIKWGINAFVNADTMRGQ